MLEFINHLFGTCGDGHPSILHDLPPVIIGIWDNITLNVKSFLKFLYSGLHLNKKRS